jgi:hypothetical protein
MVVNWPSTGRAPGPRRVTTVTFGGESRQRLCPVSHASPRPYAPSILSGSSRTKGSGLEGHCQLQILLLGYICEQPRSHRTLELWATLTVSRLSPPASPVLRLQRLGMAACTGTDKRADGSGSLLYLNQPRLLAL